MKRTIGVIVLSAMTIFSITACDYEKEYTRKCEAQGGKVRDIMDSNGKSTYYCVLPGESFTPVITGD